MLTTRKLIVLTAIVAVILTWFKAIGFIDCFYDKQFYYAIEYVFRDLTPFGNMSIEMPKHIIGCIIGLIFSFIFWFLMVILHFFGFSKAIDWCSTKKKLDK